MAVELRVDGYFEVSFHDLSSHEEVSEVIEQEILAKLQTGDYLISLNKKEVLDLKSFTPVYGFSYDPTDALEYSWDSL